MIAAWMLYCVAASSLLALAALALEHARRLRGAPLRWVWVGALLGSLTLSVLPWTRPGKPAEMAAPRPGVEASALETNKARATTGPHAAAAAAHLPSRGSGRLGAHLADRMDRPLTLLWMLLSGAAVLVWTAAVQRLRRRRRLWRRARVDGVSVLLSRDTGPAVVGFLDRAIVLPEWILDLEEERRRLVLAHEQEHLRTGDPQLLTLAFAALVLTPWNAALWWQVRRLRQSIELDCDRRVLAGRPVSRTYGELLIEIGRRVSRHGVALAAFSEPSSFLERRIRTMIMMHRERRFGRMVASMAAALAVLLVAFACEVPSPTLAEASPSTAWGNAEAHTALSESGVLQVPDTLVVYLSDTVMKLRVRTSEADGVSEHTAATCGFPQGDMGWLWWPDCAGYTLFASDHSVLPSRVRPVAKHVVVGGPAWNVGLRDGDEIVAIDGRDARLLVGPFRNLRDPREHSPEDPYRVRVRRGTEEFDLEFPVHFPVPSADR